MWITNNGIYRPFPNSSQVPILEPKVYQLGNDVNGFYLKECPPFVLPKKIYGDTSITQRWKRSFEENSEKNLGIILSGVKGSGKTITAQKFCIEMGLPVIIISQAYQGSDFISFMTDPSIGQAIIFIDEFEKVYNEKDEAQVDFISLMDGAYNTKLIFLLTVNKYHINDYLVNRLNRIKYRAHYTNLDKKVVDEVIDDMLINKAHRESIHEFFETLQMCTFDLLVNIIKEMNLFNEDAITAGKHLNLETTDSTYDIFEIVGGRRYRLGIEHNNFRERDAYIVSTLYRENDNPNQPLGAIFIDCPASNLEQLGPGHYKYTHKDGSVLEYIRRKEATDLVF